MIKKQIKLYLLIFFTLLFFILSFFIGKRNEDKTKGKIDVNFIETKLHTKEIHMENLLLEIKKLINSYPSSTFNKRDVFFEKIKEPHDKSITIFVFLKDSLMYWSSNNAPIPIGFNSINKNSHTIIKLQNGWYELITKQAKPYTIIGLLKIKNNYYYDNEFLLTEFFSDLNISKNIILSTTHTSIGKDISSVNGDYLFSLIPPRILTYEQKDLSIVFVFFYLSLFLFWFTITHILKLKNSQKKIIFYKSFILTISIFFSSFVVFVSSKTILLNDVSFLGQKFYNSFSTQNVFWFLIIVTILFFVILNTVLSSRYKFKKSISKTVISFILALFILLILFIINYFLKFTSVFIKTTNISFELNNILNVKIYLLYFYFTILLVFASFIFLINLLFTLFIQSLSKKNLFVVYVFSYIVAIFIISNLFYVSVLSIVFEFVLISYILIIKIYKKHYTVFIILTILFIITSFIVLFQHSNKKNKQLTYQKQLLTKLKKDRDIIAENFLMETDNRLFKDSLLTKMITNVSYNQDSVIVDYLQKKYFYGFWEKYNLSVTLCGNIISYNPENQASNCKGYYLNKLDEFGTKISNTNFWLLNDNSGKITYLGIFDVPNFLDKRKLTLYISLYEKLRAKSLGYPKLLIDKSVTNNNDLDNYSYAKYINGSLAVKYGSYFYNLDDKEFKNVSGKLFFYNNYYHLIYNDNLGQLIVVSRRTEPVIKLVISFAYLFVFFNIITLILFVLYNVNFIFKKLSFNFTNQIRFAMIFILLLSFIIFGAGTVYFTIKQDKKVKNKEIADKIQSVLVELQQKLQTETHLTPSWHTDKYAHLDELLIKFSKVFFSDINLFDLNGNLLATSRAEIFNKGLISKQMNSEAFKMMKVKKRTEFIHNESIGKLHFLSIYIPLENENNKVIAYINLPYFTTSSNVKNTISNVFITTLNIYLILFIITLFIAFLISSAISQPLRVLQSKFKAVQLGKTHQAITYNKQDEIGDLVKEYNLMVSKLDISAKQLAESERESAWREMAKQIAHEIKNPLTPMKLSIQFLQKAWNDISDNNTVDFEHRLNTVSETLIEQINTLSAIASEFSAFAKMPQNRKEQVEIVHKLKIVARLFENTSNINLKLILNNINELFIIADKEQLSRVFINLLKNAIQAIPEGKKGQIKIILTATPKNALIIIEDNGKGIPEDKKARLFEPTFTTKTTGTGVGLAIVKNIVNGAGGEIWFETKLNKGTRFFVKLKRTDY